MDLDDQVRAGFLEDAQETIQGIYPELEKLFFNLSDHEALATVVRRFRDLKGGALVVGQDEFGLAAMACQQCFEEWLTEYGMACKELVSFGRWALCSFERWIHDLWLNTAEGWNASEFTVKARAIKPEA